MGPMTPSKDANLPPGCIAVDFVFNRVRVVVFGRVVVDKELDGKPKTYTFFAAEDSSGAGGALVARSSTGGLALLFATAQLPRIRPNVDYLATEL